MASQLAWLDYSEDDQRHAREILKLFSQQESRDELGIGAIRDALSDALFPGTSVLLTRARYLLFVPWLFVEGGRRGYVGAKLIEWVEWQERRLIEALRSGGDTAGLIGRIAGELVQNLPSAVYWNSLKRFGILRHDGTMSQVSEFRQSSAPGGAEATEFVERSGALWSPSIPPPPQGFFEMKSATFSMTEEESSWLTERIIERAPHSLLGVLVAHRAAPTQDSAFPWTDPTCESVEDVTMQTIQEARRFSLLMHGAGLLYNVLLAERAETLGLTKFANAREQYVANLDEWEEEASASDLGSWNLQDLSALVIQQSRAIRRPTRDFVESWLQLVRGSTGHNLSASRPARRLIEARELFQKGPQARLRNDRLMRQWGGASGIAALDYRWPVVTELLRDIAAGRGVEDVGA